MDVPKTRRTLRWPAILGVLLALTPGLGAFSVGEKARSLRLEIISHLRVIRPMVYNFPCEPFPACLDGNQTQNSKPVDARKRILDYNGLKQNYQVALLDFYRRRYLDSYARFIITQQSIESMLEELSLSYLERSERMLHQAIEKKNENNPEDVTAVDITIEFGTSAKLFRDYKVNRLPSEKRRYNPRLYHYSTVRGLIESHMNKGYSNLVAAEDARRRALLVGKKKTGVREKLKPDERRERIQLYLASIASCRAAKKNAESIFQLKYPFDLYPLTNPTGKSESRPGQVGQEVEIAGETMNWSENPYIKLKNLNPVFDLRIPPDFRRDAVDIRTWVYNDEVKVNIKMQLVESEENQPQP